MHSGRNVLILFNTCYVSLVRTARCKILGAVLQDERISGASLFKSRQILEMTNTGLVVHEGLVASVTLRLLVNLSTVTWKVIL
jgi:hypothetical protein